MSKLSENDRAALDKIEKLVSLMEARLPGGLRYTDITTDSFGCRSENFGVIEISSKEEAPEPKPDTVADTRHKLRSLIGRW